MTRLKMWLVRIGYRLAQIYWFIFRPHYRGAKIVLTYQDQVLLIRHTYGPYYWTFPGGKIEKDEEPEQAVRREVKEELGINLDKVVSTGSFTLDSNDFKHDEIFTFWAELKSKDFIADPVEIAEVKWYPKDEFPLGLGKNAKQIYQQYLNSQL